MFAQPVGEILLNKYVYRFSSKSQMGWQKFHNWLEQGGRFIWEPGYPCDPALGGRRKRGEGGLPPNFAELQSLSEPTAIAWTIGLGV